MEMYFLSRCYNRYGHSNVYSPIGELLRLRLADYGQAIQTFEIIAYLRSATNNSPTLVGLFNQHHADLTKLPKVAFRRTQKKVTIDYESKVRSAEEEGSRRPSIDATNAAAKEFVAVLSLLEKRLTKSDDFDYRRFIADATELLTHGFLSEEEIRLVSEQAEQERMAERATKSPWELLDIDWSKFHPEAKGILDDTFFWECANDFTPHGNDTGADLLADYLRWAKKNSKSSPLVFLARLFSNWGITPIDWKVTDAREVNRLKAERRIELHVCNEAIIALAFAVLKVRGECPQEVADFALKALQRDSYDFIEDGMTTENKELHQQAIAKMRAKLERC